MANGWIIIFIHLLINWRTSYAKAFENLYAMRSDLIRHKIYLFTNWRTSYAKAFENLYAMQSNLFRHKIYLFTNWRTSYAKAFENLYAMQSNLFRHKIYLFTNFAERFDEIGVVQNFLEWGVQKHSAATKEFETSQDRKSNAKLSCYGF